MSTHRTGTFQMITTHEAAPHVVVVTIDRPERLNSVDHATSVALSEAIDLIEDDDEVRAWVLTGTGRAFCAGADLKAVAAGGRSPRLDPHGFGGLVRRVRTKPVVAAVNGLALGGGFEIVLACDLVVMAEDAWLGLPEASRGLAASNGGLVRLARFLPPVVAAEVVAAGRTLTAPEALGFGLVNAVAPGAEVVQRAVGLAVRVAANAPLAVRGGLDVLRSAAWAGSEAEAWAASDERSGEVNRSADASEGPRAFAEKRSPQWRGC